MDLYRQIHTFDESVGLLLGSDLAARVPVHSTEVLGSWIAYTRSVLSRAVNLLSMVTIVVDAASFRPTSSFHPASLTGDAFVRERAEEHAALISQVIGRVLRGKPEKRVAVIILNSDPELGVALNESRIFHDSCEREPLFVESEDIHEAIVRIDQWLAGDGEGGFPPPDPKLRRPKGRPKQGVEELETRAVTMAQGGKNWTAIYTELNLKRLPKEDRDRIRKACEAKTYADDSAGGGEEEGVKNC
jgi:hypothetical protein